MPQVKSAKSLKAVCIDFILENQEIFCERFPIGEVEDVVAPLDSNKPATNPFDGLPTKLVEELVRLLRKKESYRSDDQTPYLRKTYKITAFLKLLLTPRLRTLDLTDIKKECISDISDVLQLAAIKSPQLETLRLDLTCEYAGNLNLFISKFSKLRILKIFPPERCDESFGLIGKHCPDLRELTCIDCIELTDDGIRNLCVDGNCKSIRLLNLERCRKITTRGIQMALDNLPHLRILRHESLLECLDEIAETAINQKLILPKYSLTALYILHDAVYKIGSLPKSVLLCPNVTGVYLIMFKVERFDDAELLSLLSLEKLEIIVITHAEFADQVSRTLETRIDRGLTFDGVVPLIKKFGYHLKRLHLDRFYSVDIPAITEFCPNLEHLAIIKCETKRTNHTSETTVTKTPTLRYLKRLIVENLAFENLFSFLSSPLISYVHILTCNGLTDQVLQSAASLHSFRNLEYLMLVQCQSVTKKGINIFLQESNPLRKIVLYQYNSGYTDEDISDWNENVIWIKRNWRFQFILMVNGRY